MLATTQSKVRSGTEGIIWASPARKSTGISSGVRRRAVSTHSGLRSMPTTIPSGPTMRAAAREAPPDPQPMSSTRSFETMGAQLSRLS